MKFSLFAHVESTQANPNYSQLYSDLISLVQMAEQGGMTTFWMGEHHGMAFTVSPNPFSVLIDVANKTSTIRLGTGTIVAPFWHPIKLAGEAAMADILTGGRLELGIARGAYQFEYERLMPQMDAWEAGLRMREIVPLLPKLWSGNCVNEGEFYPFPKTTSCPQPVQLPHPPIWVAARDPNSHEFAVSNDCNVQVTPLWQGDDEIASLMERFKKAQELSGHHGGKIMLLQHGYIGKDAEDCDKGARALSRFYNYFGAWFKNERTTNFGQIDPLSDEEIAANEMMSASNLASNLLIGEKNAVIERLKYYEELGYDEFSFWLDNGLPFDEKRQQLKRFIEDIMPSFSESSL